MDGAGVVVALTVLLFAAPVLVDLLVSDRSRKFGYLAADGFYYLTVARNIVEHGLVSFDQTFPTNGFHPLWQFTLAGLYGMAHGLGAGGAGVISLTIVVNVVLIALGIYGCGHALREPGGRLSPLFLTLPVGGYGVLASSMWLAVGSDLPRHNRVEGSMPLFGTLWSYVNGMETALLLALLGAVAAVFVRAEPGARSDGWALGLGALLGAFTLARLDHIFFAAAILAVIAVEGLAKPRGLRPFWLAAFAFALPVGAYVATNWVFFDSLIPVSGMQKSTFPVPQRGNFRLALALLSGDHPQWMVVAIRLTLMLVPVCFATFYLPVLFRLSRGSRGLRIRLRELLTRFDVFLGALALGTILLGVHNFLFVYAFFQWHWYYPVSTVFVGLFVIRTLDRAMYRRLQGRVRIVGWMAAITVVSVFYFVHLHRHTDRNTRYADFYYEEAPRLRSHYAAQPPRLLSFDDGIIAFATGFPTMSGLGLNLDPEAAQAFARRQLLDLALARGHDRITSMAYGDGARFFSLRSLQGIARRYARTLPLYEPLHPYEFSLDYLSPAMDFAVVRVERR